MAPIRGSMSLRCELVENGKSKISSNFPYIKLMNINSITPLKLIQIAAWQLRRLVPEYSEYPTWVAALPSLQRDAVWKPGQVELLWDSLFRGFPIGAIVVSEKLENQNSRPGKVSGSQDPWPENDVEKRHLLDGQQRCNSIALGFSDPFSREKNITRTDSVDNILWIDLLPKPGIFKSESTRHFLFRLTTSAHPWGYSGVDKADRLQASKMQGSLRILKDECGWKPPQNDQFQRPLAVDLWPAEADTPIPLAWILLEALKGKKGTELWDAVRERCETSPYRWAQLAAKGIAATSSSELLNDIEAGLSRSLSSVLFALELPTATIRAKSKQELSVDSVASPEAQNLSNVEHLFQRLNNGGTPISPEELQYSMIKAYWPGIEDTIGALHRLPMRASLLAVLGARAAMVTDHPTPTTFPGNFSVSSLRGLAIDPQREDKKLLVSNYFGIAETSQKATDQNLFTIQHPSVSIVVKTIDEWLLNRNEDDFGLPPALRTAIAHRSPEVYLLIMIIAERVIFEGADIESFRKPVLGLATALHWFHQDQSRAVRRIYTMLLAETSITAEFFVGILCHQSGDVEATGLLNIVNPASLKKTIGLPNVDNLENWDFYTEIVTNPAKGDPIELARLENFVAPLVWRIIGQKELLIYCQRKWLRTRFQTFDRADASAWEDHNCPWDYDHLLPSSTFHNVRNARYLTVCQRWGNTIGNFHILPFEDNRGRGKKPANIAFATDCDLDLMLVLRHELDAFSLTRDGVVDDRDSVLDFVKATRRRILAIYEDWYRSLNMETLLKTSHAVD